MTSVNENLKLKAADAEIERLRAELAILKPLARKLAQAMEEVFFGVSRDTRRNLAETSQRVLTLTKPDEAADER